MKRFIEQNDIFISVDEEDVKTSVGTEQFGFRYREVTCSMSKEEQLTHVCTVAYNALFFHLEGELHITWGKFKDVVIKPGDTYFLPRGAMVTACASTPEVKYLVARLEHQLDNKRFGDLCKQKATNELTYKFAPLKMSPLMHNFVDTVKMYFLDGVICGQLQQVKFAELHILFTKCYSLDECTQLFYPVVGFNSEFENFILDTYEASMSIEDLASKANMSRSTFDRKFKESFGITPLKWIEEQTRLRILSKASEPNVSVKDVMYEIGICNHSQFTHLCKRLCGTTPSQLIRLSN